MRLAPEAATEEAPFETAVVAEGGGGGPNGYALTVAEDGVEEPFSSPVATTSAGPSPLPLPPF